MKSWVAFDVGNAIDMGRCASCDLAISARLRIREIENFCFWQEDIIFVFGLIHICLNFLISGNKVVFLASNILIIMPAILAVSESRSRN